VQSCSNAVLQSVEISGANL